eukprot:Platyproteum_vivax@DN6771_c0_g1_i1.p1
MKFNGGAAASTFIYLLPTYFAMIPLGLWNTETSIWKCDWKKALFASLSDISHQLLEKLGLVFAGSAVYMIIGSSSIVWTAILSVLMIPGKKPLLHMQWAGILMIFCGMALRAFQTDFEFGNDEFLGIVLTSIAAILHGFNYVINERYLTGADAIPGPALVCMMGIINSTILTVWTLVWTVPQWNTLIVQRIEEAQGSYWVCALCFVALCVAGFVRSATLWYLLKHLGAVSSGVLKGIRSASVFVLSHFLFCHLQASQCMTTTKAASAVVCIGGVVVYSTAKKPGKKEESLPLVSLQQKQ